MSAFDPKRTQLANQGRDPVRQVEELDNNRRDAL